jgi:4-diphosphocytidyl-2-C-methyl-D-erythritol kinase
MSVLRALAPAKVNLGLFLGPVRPGDGRHELLTVMQSISLADELTLGPAPAGAERDELSCAGVPGPPDQNLAAKALAAFRARTGWAAPPQRLEIVKRIPVAAGLAGGSADAAAALRLARGASGLGDESLLRELAAELGADVPAQVSPGRWLAAGAGERLSPLAHPDPTFGLLVLPLAGQLSTAEVYAQADRLGLQRPAAELEELGARLSASLERGAPLPEAAELLQNDLQPAALALCPAIDAALRAARAAGAELALVSGSGPTVVGIFAGSGASAGAGPALAQRAAELLSDRRPTPLWATPVEAAFAQAAAV